jgi:type II secretory pathway component PulF
VWYSVFGGLGLGVYGRLAVVTRTLSISVLSVTTTSIITQIISPILLAVVAVVVAVVVVLIIRRHG